MAKETTELGIIGLGRMGSGLARRLLAAEHHCVAFDLSAAAMRGIEARGVPTAASLPDLVSRLQRPRIVWLMVPVAAVDQTLARLAPLLSSDDIVVDGGNSYYRDDIRRAAELRRAGIHYVDVGTSGGVFGEERGYCLMYGGETAVVERLEPIFAALAPSVDRAPRTRSRKGPVSTAEHGYLHCGPTGSGHFVKMVHNGIEYGLMAAYAEGLNILRHAAYDLDVPDIAEVWRRGSVVASWLLDLTADALLRSPDLEGFSGRVSDSGFGRWTIQTAIEESVPTPVLSAALNERFSSRGNATFANKILSAMRREFGGHVEPAAEGEEARP